MCAWVMAVFLLGVVSPLVGDAAMSVAQDSVSSFQLPVHPGVYSLARVRRSVTWVVVAAVDVHCLMVPQCDLSAPPGAAADAHPDPA